MECTNKAETSAAVLRGLSGKPPASTSALGTQGPSKALIDIPADDPQAIRDNLFDMANLSHYGGATSAVPQFLRTLTHLVEGRRLPHRDTALAGVVMGRMLAMDGAQDTVGAAGLRMATALYQQGVLSRTACTAMRRASMDCIVANHGARDVQRALLEGKDLYVATLGLDGEVGSTDIDRSKMTAEEARRSFMHYQGAWTFASAESRDAAVRAAREGLHLDV